MSGSSWEGRDVKSGEREPVGAGGRARSSSQFWEVMSGRVGGELEAVTLKKDVCTAMSTPAVVFSFCIAGQRLCLAYAGFISI